MNVLFPVVLLLVPAALAAGGILVAAGIWVVRVNPDRESFTVFTDELRAIF